MSVYRTQILSNQTATGANAAIALANDVTNTARTLTVPTGVSAITKIIAVLVHDGAATGRAAATVRISGDAVGGTGVHDICIGAMVVGAAATGAPMYAPPAIVPVNIPVAPSNSMSLQAFITSDLGAQDASVTLEFT